MLSATRLERHGSSQKTPPLPIGTQICRGIDSPKRQNLRNTKQPSHHKCPIFPKEVTITIDSEADLGAQ
jgi:hypothetical protein